jgi:hypothetical protein
MSHQRLLKSPPRRNHSPNRSHSHSQLNSSSSSSDSKLLLSKLQTVVARMALHLRKGEGATPTKQRTATAPPHDELAHS